MNEIPFEEIKTSLLSWAMQRMQNNPSTFGRNLEQDELDSFTTELSALLNQSSHDRQENLFEITIKFLIEKIKEINPEYALNVIKMLFSQANVYYEGKFEKGGWFPRNLYLRTEHLNLILTPRLEDIRTLSTQAALDTLKAESEDRIISSAKDAANELAGGDLEKILEMYRNNVSNMGTMVRKFVNSFYLSVQITNIIKDKLGVYANQLDDLNFYLNGEKIEITELLLTNISFSNLDLETLPSGTNRLDINIYLYYKQES